MEAPTPLCPIHRALRRPWRPDAIFRVRVEIFAGAFPLDFGPGVFWTPPLASLPLCQRFYLHLRDRSGAGASQFSDGWVLDQNTGQTVARISYNGRLWHPRPWRSGDVPVAEAPPRVADPAPRGGAVVSFLFHPEPWSAFP